MRGDVVGSLREREEEAEESLKSRVCSRGMQDDGQNAISVFSSSSSLH